MIKLLIYFYILGVLFALAETAYQVYDKSMGRLTVLDSFCAVLQEKRFYKHILTSWYYYIK